MRHVTREEMQEADRTAIEDYGVPGVVLMENAGRGAAACALEILGESAGPAAIVCGSGNNGGDGYVVARHLHNHRVEVVVHLLSDREKVGGDARTNLAIIEHMGLDVRQTPPDELGLSGAELVVDAIFGTGLSGAVRPPYDAAIRVINDAPAPVLAIDIPSGLDANTGEVLGVCVRADRTATFALPKVGFTRGSGPDMIGELTVVDIGMPREVLER